MVSTEELQLVDSSSSDVDTIVLKSEKSEPADKVN